MAADSGDRATRGDDEEPTGEDGPSLPPVDEREPPVPPAFREYATDDLPNATPRGHGKDGVLEATFGRSDGGPTRLLRDRAEVPLHLTGTLDHDPLGPTLCVQEPTGGVAQGDRHRIAIEAREEARAAVATQSATTVHSMHSDYAHLDVALDVGPDAHLEFVPRPTIVNEDARCLVTTRVDLAAGASAILADVLVPDGLSAHDPFDFDHYHARLAARREGALVCADAVDLRPAERDPQDPATVGEANAVGTLYVLAPSGDADPPDEKGGRIASIADLADRIHDSVNGVAPTDETFRAGASVLPFEAGVGVRAVGVETAAVEEALGAARDEARRALFGVGAPEDRWY